MTKFLAILLAAFIIMKAANVITWSWWTVFIPAYIIIFLYIIALICVYYQLEQKVKSRPPIASLREKLLAAQKERQEFDRQQKNSKQL